MRASRCWREAESGSRAACRGDSGCHMAGGLPDAFHAGRTDAGPGSTPPGAAGRQPSTCWVPLRSRMPDPRRPRADCLHGGCVAFASGSDPAASPSGAPENACPRRTRPTRISASSTAHARHIRILQSTKSPGSASAAQCPGHHRVLRVGAGPATGRARDAVAHFEREMARATERTTGSR